MADQVYELQVRRGQHNPLKVRGEALRGIVGDAPDDLDQRMSQIRRLPRWIGLILILTTSAGLWAAMAWAVMALLGR